MTSGERGLHERVRDLLRGGADDAELVKRRTLEGMRVRGDHDPRNRQPVAVAMLYRNEVGDSLLNWPEADDGWLQVPHGMVIDREEIR